jgi:hypothetical protein
MNLRILHINSQVRESNTKRTNEQKEIVKPLLSTNTVHSCIDAGRKAAMGLELKRSEILLH